jgi:hypothetical protein
VKRASFNFSSFVMSVLAGIFVFAVVCNVGLGKALIGAVIVGALLAVEEKEISGVILPKRLWKE